MIENGKRHFQFVCYMEVVVLAAWCIWFLEIISFSMGCRFPSPDGRKSLEIFSCFASIELKLVYQMTCRPGSMLCKYVFFIYFNKSTVRDFPSRFH
jgi:hypothetical protein